MRAGSRRHLLYAARAATLSVEGCSPFGKLGVGEKSVGLRECSVNARGSSHRHRRLFRHRLGVRSAQLGSLVTRRAIPTFRSAYHELHGSLVLCRTVRPSVDPGIRVNMLEVAQPPPRGFPRWLHQGCAWECSRGAPNPTERARSVSRPFGDLHHWRLPRSRGSLGQRLRFGGRVAIPRRNHLDFDASGFSLRSSCHGPHQGGGPHLTTRCKATLRGPGRARRGFIARLFSRSAEELHADPQDASRDRAGGCVGPRVSPSVSPGAR